MILIDERYAAYNRADYGPTFGNGHDLVIRDRCNENLNSSAYFPYSYNCTVNSYSNGQMSYNSFSGAINGHQFKVV